jgi:hypothetical protein
LIVLVRTLVVVQALLATAVHGAEGGRVAGAYIFGHEVRSFQPCGSTKIYWTKAVSPKVSASLRKRHTELAARPYGRIYVVVSGRPIDEKTAGFAESYAGYFEISELLQADGQIPPGCAIH